MLAPDIARRIREIEIYTRRLVSGSLIGDTTSAYKGTGLDFDQLRDYQQGDDVRFIDWHSSARSDRLLVKQYIEERNRTVLLAVDCSASTIFGSQQRLKYEVMAELAAILALVGNYGKDRVGLLLFSDAVELYIPPARGMMHTRLIMEKIFTTKPRSSRTNITRAFEYLAQLKKRNALVFVISDFIDQNFEKSLSLVSRMYDMVAICVNDEHEQTIPNVGLLRVKDSETGECHILDLRNKNHAMLTHHLDQQKKSFERNCGRYGIDLVHMRPESCTIGSLVRLFRRRMRY